MYNEKAEKHDEKMTERWKGDAEGILVFTGLFSAALAQLLVGSLQNLRLSSQDASSFYLARIYQLTPGSNPSSVTLPPDPSQFLTPKSAIWTNTLWSLSLVISLTCALLAILLQQWARRYIRITQKADDPQRRARIREFMFQGSKKRLPLRFMLELLTALLHIAVFLFLAGFIVYLFTFNRFVAMTAAVSAGACTMLYLSISFAPIVFHDSPYYTPLSTLVWIVSNGAIWLGLRLRHSATLRSPSSKPAYTIRQSLHNCYLRITRGITKEVGDLARTQSSFLDTSVISRTFDSIDGDQDMEKFLTCIPGFYRSSDVKKDASALEKFNRKRFPPAIVSFMDRSLSSELLTDTEKWRRIAISFSVINADPQILQGTFQRALQVPESVIFNHLPFVHLSQSRVNDTDPWVRDYARCIVPSLLITSTITITIGPSSFVNIWACQNAAWRNTGCLVIITVCDSVT
ncbi:hypothetical protein BJV78DRAFT_386609 [Lactifluus subvellereus]|nr:hypothetical protein BJV78DRAFT_386609 [Lactifluus subvellereus]